MSTRRKHSAISGTEDSKNTFLSQGNKNPIAQHVSTVPSDSINIMKNRVGNEVATTQNNHLKKIDNIDREIDYCRFPYYRSNKANIQDAVLVKDVGVSCKLLNEDTVGSDLSISGLESYLVRQLKLEYNELSSITKKINAYTKDILNNLASRCIRKHHIQKLHVKSKHIMSPCINETTENICLKSRFQNDAKRKCRSSEIDLDRCSENEINRKKIHGNRKSKKRCVELDKVFAKKYPELSSKYSGVLLRNYLIMKKEKVLGNVSKGSLCKIQHSTSSGKSRKDHDVNKSRELFYTNKCNSQVLTNWLEMSKRRNCKSKSALTAKISES